MTLLASDATVAVIGAGTMGSGIAQVAAAAGHPVRLFDVTPGAAIKGRERLAADLRRLADRGKLSREEADAIIGRVTVAEDLPALAGAKLAIEAIVEDLGVKRGLIASLEAILDDNAIIATNTSSISITALARDAARPARIAGMHFFNPAPVMRLVEIVSGLATDPDVAAALFETATRWGKVAVHTRSTPGFIVNRVARGYYGEALRLYEEGVADPATIDALMTAGGGFRMGPFALMDLIGHDVNYAVSVSVFDAYHGEPRFRPSIAQAELVASGRLGRKTGRGFFDYGPGAVAATIATETVHGDAADVRADVDIIDSDGRTAATISATTGRPTIVRDVIADAPRRIGFAASADVPDNAIRSFVAGLAAGGTAATRLPDWPGLVATRTLAVIVNEAFEALLQGVADEGAIDEAMRHGVNYPHGPIGWARRLGLARIVSVLDEVFLLTGDPRYRTSLALRFAAA